MDYLLFRRDAFITRMSQTKEGREYLRDAHNLEQVNPDRKALRDQFGKES